MKSGRSRRRARERALQILYKLDISGGSPGDEGCEGYTRTLVEGVLEKKGEIDKLIAASAENWTLDRMAVVDRNILRLAVYEMKYRDDVPYRVAIDEAVELANLYGSKDSGAFVNGILDRIHRQGGKAGPVAAGPA